MIVTLSSELKTPIPLISDSVTNGIWSPLLFVQSEQGAETGRRLWIELSEKLEAIHPGILQNI